MTGILYHYTCPHAAAKITASGLLLASPCRALPQIPALVWLTDLDTPLRDVLGLPPIQPGCDRVAWRAIVECPDDVHHWPRWAKANTHRHQRAQLETASHGTMPMHWYLVMGNVPVVSINPV